MHVLVLSDRSTAVQVTMFVPTGKAEPEGVSQLKSRIPPQSEAETTKLTTAEHWPGSLVWVMLVGQARSGGVSSKTVTTAAQAFDAPWLSTTRSVTLLLPSG